MNISFINKKGQPLIGLPSNTYMGRTSRQQSVLKILYKATTLLIEQLKFLLVL